MNVRDTSYMYYMVIHSRAEYGMTISKDKYAVVRTKSCHKPYKCDIEVKGQGQIGLMNLRETSSHSDRRMCQIW